MPKDDAKFSKESNLKTDSRLISRETEYPRIISTVKQMTPPKMKSPAEMEGKGFRVPYDEEHNPDENLGAQWVQPEAFDSKSTQDFKK